MLCFSVTKLGAPRVAGRPPRCVAALTHWVRSQHTAQHDCCFAGDDDESSQHPRASGQQGMSHGGKAVSAAGGV